MLYFIYIPVIIASVLVNIPSLLFFIAINISGWFYKIRLLFWLPIVFGIITIILHIIDRIFIKKMPEYFTGVLDWFSSFYLALILLMPMAGLIFSKIKFKKIDKLFLFAFLINIALFVFIIIANPDYFIFRGV